VNGLSLHRYYGNNAQDTGGDSSKYVALNILMDRQIKESLAVCDLVQGHKRSRKQLWLSFDEWNVWYRERTGKAVDGGGKQAPHLLEEVYNFEDALLVGGLINTLVRNADRVKVACLAQLINVIAPIMTNADGILRQTIYYPYSWALQYARGNVLNLLIESPTYDVPGIEQVPYLDVAGTVDPKDGTRTLLVLNRDLSKARALEVNWEDKVPGKVITSSVLTGSDLKAVNSFDAPQRVVPQTLDKPTTTASSTRIEVPARSYSVIQWSA
jgi:alpha-N-arabinofuranosidase